MRLDYRECAVYMCHLQSSFCVGLGSFPIEPVTQDCTEYQECLIQCRNRPKCEPAAECRVEWKKGPGTDYNVRVSERIAVDGKGMHFVGKVWLVFGIGCVYITVHCSKTYHLLLLTF